MLLALISLAWLVVALVVVAVCSMAARGDAALACEVSSPPTGRPSWDLWVLEGPPATADPTAVPAAL